MSFSKTWNSFPRFFHSTINALKWILDSNKPYFNTHVRLATIWMIIHPFWYKKNNNMILTKMHFTVSKRSSSSNKTLLDGASLFVVLILYFCSTRNSNYWCWINRFRHNQALVLVQCDLMSTKITPWIEIYWIYIRFILASISIACYEAIHRFDYYRLSDCIFVGVFIYTAIFRFSLRTIQS